MIGLILLLLGGAPAHPHVIVQPNWDVRPTSDDLREAYPPDAQAAGIEGHVTVVCAVAVDETLNDCVVVEETPSGYGFGAAVLLGVTPKMRLHPQTVDGTPVGGARVRIPLNFKFDEQESYPGSGLGMSETCVGVAQAAVGEDALSRRDYLFWLRSFTVNAADEKIKPSEIIKRLEAARLAAAPTLATPQGRELLGICRRVVATILEAQPTP